MRNMCMYLCAVLLFVFSFTGCSTQNYTIDTFEAAINQSTTAEQVIQVCQEYCSASEDMELVAHVQDIWKDFDEDSMRSFFRSKYEEDQDSPLNAYFLGKVTTSPREAIELGRSVIRMTPEEKWGYSLVMSTYYRTLFHGGRNPGDRESLVSHLPHDVLVFANFLETFPNDEDNLRYLFEYYLYSHQAENAQQILQLARERELRWATRSSNDRILLAMQDDPAGLFEDVSNEVNAEIEEGTIPQEESRYEVPLRISQALRSAYMYERALPALQRAHRFLPADKRKEHYYNLACLASLNNNTDLALDYLERSAEAGYSDTVWPQRDSDLFALHDDPRWTGVLQSFENNWNSGRRERRREALASQIDVEAPEFSLADSHGDTVRFEDLRGYIVILDFWATWCGPCRMAMPEIDQYLREDAGENVRVFSVNVWENNPIKARLFMMANDYAMTLLYGTNELPVQYEVPGIPTIFVIDSEGHIRYKEVGYEGGLRDKLGWWVSAL